MKKFKSLKKSIEKNPKKLLSSMIVGSSAARILSYVYGTISFVLAIVMREQIMYCIPLFLGSIAVFWYAGAFLSLKDVKKHKNNPNQQVISLKEHLLKRKKYEGYVVSFWILTLMPWYIKTTNSILAGVILLGFVVAGVMLGGNSLFKKSEDMINDIECQLNNTEDNFNTAQS